MAISSVAADSALTSAVNEVLIAARAFAVEAFAVKLNYSLEKTGVPHKKLSKETASGWPGIAGT